MARTPFEKCKYPAEIIAAAEARGATVQVISVKSQHAIVMRFPSGQTITTGFTRSAHDTSPRFNGTVALNTSTRRTTITKVLNLIEVAA